jgi:TolB-like protein
MTTEGFRRKLTAILSADVEGYSRLMGDDEDATVRTLTAYRTIMATLIQKHRGRVVDSPGDNLLAEFASVVDAVECAVKIQGELKGRNAELPKNRKMEFRIGVNLGDVIEDGDRIYGDGINIAARVEGLAQAGGICISGTVYDSVKNKLTLAYGYLGEQSVKNISEPVRVYRVLMEPDPDGPPVGTAPDLPDKPSIAVLPFVNMSGDLEQEYFSDGITEDLITDLSKVSGLFVIARNSVFTYKGKSAKVQQVSEDLGVRYVLEGSVRKAGDRVRISAQLVDGTSGGHLWAERYDRNLGDIFALQDEVTQKIVAVLAVRLQEEEHRRVAQKNTDNVLAYDHFLRGLEYFNRYSKEANSQARLLFQKAIDLDPKYAMAYAKAGWTHLIDWTMGWSQDPQSLDRAFELAKKATSLNDTIEGSHCLLGNIYLWKKQHEKAIALYEKSTALNPNYADGFSELGSILIFSGRSGEAIELIEKAIRLDPLYPFNRFNLGHAYFLNRRYEEAMAALKGALEGSPDFFPARAFLAAIYIELGREEEARAEAVEILKKSPGTTLEVWRDRLPYKNQSDLERVLDALGKAGLE